MLSQTQKRAAFAIVNVFETGSVLGDYGQVTIIPGDSGHLTYGRSQTTLRAGNGPGKLGELLRIYAATPGARFARLLEPYLPRVADGDIALDGERHLHNILRACADDPLMRDAQDDFFERGYWAPAVKAAQSCGFVLPLSHAVVYDSIVHGSWESLRKSTTQSAGAPSAANEKAWIQAYVRTRRTWLAEHANPVLHACVYRMDAFERLIALDQWTLELPFMVRGHEVSSESLSALPPGCYNGPAPGSRSLGVQTPLQRGLDVRLLQLGLSERGIPVVADGVFGKGSLLAMNAFLKQCGRPAVPSADAALVAEICGFVTGVA